MNLMPELLTAVKACGYEEPTPIQRETIPPVLEGRDVLGCAQTGTGKTAAFALPILQRLHTDRKQHQNRRSIRALILTPTRELALQIMENFVDYGKNLPLRSCVIFGGVGQSPQVQQLRRGVDILVATPGRLNDLIGQGFIALDHIEIFVLDEADRMLDMGFIHDVKKVIALLPKKRQTLFFSATMPAEVEKLALGILNEPVTVKVDPVSSTVDTIEQYLYLVDKANKKLLLADLLNKPEVESALVFTRTKHGADRVVRELSRAGINARAIHGDKSQNVRQEALAQFKSGKVKVMIATDIAARGIDIAGLSHVVNYDLPNEPESYVHRIGRTGRAGHEGVAISFCCIDEMKDLKAIERLIGKEIPRMESQWPMEVFTETVKQPRQPRPARRVEGQPNGVRQRETAAYRGKAEAPREARPRKAEGSGRDLGIADKRQSAPKAGAQPRQGTSGARQGASSRPGASGLRQSAAGVSGAADARPAMRATPLERTVRTTPISRQDDRHGFASERRTEPAGREAQTPTAPSYEQYMRQKRRTRITLATGEDRR